MNTKPHFRIASGGSFQNRIAEVSKMPAPEVGMGATIMMYTDRKAATVVEVSGKTIGIRLDNVKRTDSNGMSECQSYEYTPGDGLIQYFTLRRTGQWVRRGESARSGQVVALGHRDHYHDFSF